MLKYVNSEFELYTSKQVDNLTQISRIFLTISESASVKYVLLLS